jgi:outer membrane protein assembly factor BamB
MQNYGFPQGIEVIGKESVLICEGNHVAEYDLKTGKQGWKYSVNLPTSVQRLPNGNTLIAALNNNQSRAIEIDPSGDILWEYKSKDGLSIQKAYRR